MIFRRDAQRVVAAVRGATQQEKDGSRCEGQDAIKVDSKAGSVNRSCRWSL